MKQVLGIMLVLALTSFAVPGSKTTGAPEAVKAKAPFNSTVYLANYGGAANDMVIYIGAYSFNTTYADPNNFWQETIGYLPEGSYGLLISKLTPDSTPRRVYIEDPFYQDQFGFYWSTGDFSGSINVNTTFNYISVMFQ